MFIFKYYTFDGTNIGRVTDMLPDKERVEKTKADLLEEVSSNRPHPTIHCGGDVLEEWKCGIGYHHHASYDEAFTCRAYLS